MSVKENISFIFGQKGTGKLCGQYLLNEKKQAGAELGQAQLQLC